MKHFWLPVLGALLAWSSPASAKEDIDWSGFYFGAHAGVAGALFDNEVPAFPGPTGEAASFLGGAQLGYNWQSDSIVFGGEFDVSLIDLEGDSAAGGFREDFMSTARLRAGGAFGRYLVYATAGLAGTSKEANLTGSSSDSAFVIGVAGGFGVDMMMGESWSARLEYLYANVPDDTLTSGGGSIVGGSDNHIVRGGLNFHF
jgi:outer membrane immunogenic protein